MPMVDLPLSMDNLLSNVTAVVVTHTILTIGMIRQLMLFQSHFPIFVQNAADKRTYYVTRL